MNYKVKETTYIAKIKEYGTKMVECCDRGTTWEEPHKCVIGYYERKICKKDYDSFLNLSKEQKEKSSFKSVRKEEKMISLTEEQYKEYLVSKLNAIERKNTKSSIKGRIKAIENLIEFTKEKIKRDCEEFHNQDLTIYKEDYINKITAEYNDKTNLSKEVLKEYEEELGNLKKSLSDLLEAKESRERKKLIADLNKKKADYISKIAEIDEELKALE